MITAILTTTLLTLFDFPSASALPPLETRSLNPSTIAPNSTLFLTAIIGTGGSEGISHAQCWAIQPGFTNSSQSGTIGNNILQLGDLANASYTQYPIGERHDAGLHNAPARQYVVLLSGGVTVTFPNLTDSEPFRAYAGDILIATDVVGTSKVGHDSVWESGTETLQIPWKNGKAPGHVVIDRNRPCT
ncbi:hypothetical protein BT69DRAFT_1219038 [Atractiella rhizophila]|nr:hypothetical protein BT69DRAFT_1219038 [Atractiella rhizophila]